MNGSAQWLQRNFIYVGLVCFVALLSWSAYQRYSLHQRGKYTIGYVTGWTQTLKSGRSITYRCTIRGLPYEGRSLEVKGMNAKPGARYVIVFDSLNPSSNEAYYENSIPATITVAPPNGWTPKEFNTMVSADSARTAGTVGP